MEELDKASHGHRFELLSSEQGLAQVNVLNDLKGDQLGHVHGGAPGRWLSQLPPVFAEHGSILVCLQALLVESQRAVGAYLEDGLEILFKEGDVHQVNGDSRFMVRLELSLKLSSF